MKASLFVVILFFISKSTFAQDDFQPGYYISLQGDTVKGLVKNFSTKIGHCEFKNQAPSGTQAFSQDMIRGFGSFFEDWYFESFSLPERKANDDKVFAELLFRGRADLYSYDDYFYLIKDGVSEKIGKVQQKEIGGGEGQVYSHKIYIGTLNRYFFDCLPEKLLRGEIGYNEKDFVEIFKSYSECSRSDYYVYKTPRQSRKIGFYVLAGYKTSKLKYPDDLDIFGTDNNFFFGGGVTIPLRFIGDKIFLTGELTYHRNGYRGKKEGYITSGTVLKDYIVDISSIQMPLGFKLLLTSGKAAPYLRVGGTAYYKTKVNWRIQYQGTTEEDFDVRDSTPTFVAWGGAGLQAKISARRSLFLEFRIDKWPEFVSFYGPSGAASISARSEVYNKMLLFGMNF